MKYQFALALLAFVCAACVLACDPDSNNMPTCTAANEGQLYRNFWDPTGYWQCSGNTATMVRCETEHLYDEALGRCIHYSEWVWTAPCPAS